MLIEPFSDGGTKPFGLGARRRPVVALRRGGSFRGPDRDALSAFAASVVPGLAAERSVEIERLRYGMERASASARAGRARSTTRAIQGIGALRMRLANARDLDDTEALSAAAVEPRSRVSAPRSTGCAT